MGLDRRRMLETSLFDLEQIVTVQYLSRHADIPINDARSELAEFLEENRHRTNLHAVYVLSGVLRAADERIAGDIAATSKHHRTQLVRDSDLENARRIYSEVYTCEIYCLHTKPIKSLCLLYSVDSLDDAEYIRTDPERSWLSYPEAEIKREEMLTRHGDIPMPQKDISQTKAATAAVASSSKSSELLTRKRKNDIASMFAQAATRNKQKQCKSATQTGQNDESQNADIGLEQSLKCHSEHILVDNEKLDSKEDTKLKNVSKIATEKLSLKAADSKVAMTKKRPSLLTQDDLFSDDGSDSERMDLGEARKIEKEEETPKKLRPSPCILNTSKDDDINENGNVHGGPKKATRKEYVTETFLDSDGFMVTKQVLKEIEVEQQPSANAHAGEQKKTNGVKLFESKGREGIKVPRGQAKISSFFQKK